VKKNLASHNKGLFMLGNNFFVLVYNTTLFV
jgi:hypothetical protein